MGVVPRQSRFSRSQIVLCAVGLLLAGTGILLAAVTASKESVPPLALSVAHERAGQSVAEVTGGSTGPTSAQLQIVAGDLVLWSIALPHSTTGAGVVLPGDLLVPASHVRVVSDGQRLRDVDG